ncbi:DUF669 domain-containing protein [Desulfosarcina variabilis]|uniref:DUF669 domain-containing protein n=1 Tax=Desulfosarcina variabilis TaxID=2300 RepID=UPI003AFAC50B
MKSDETQFPVVELINVATFPRITRDGYYSMVITDAHWEHPKTNRPQLQIKFEVKEGPSKGARLHRRFYMTEKSLRSLSYLCAAVGIFGKLSDPHLLIGKELVALVNLKNGIRKGSPFPEPNQFVPLNSNTGGNREQG